MIMPDAHHVGRDEVEDDVAMADDVVVALHREEDDRRRGADALVPAGEGELDRALAAGGARDGVGMPERAMICSPMLFVYV